MAILLNNDGGERHDEWREGLLSILPEHVIFEFPDIPDPNEIEYAVVWKHPKGDLRNYPNLKAVFSMGVGVEYFDQDPNLPDVPIYRLIDPVMAEDMALYTLYWVIHIRRHLETYRTQQAAKHWQRLAQSETALTEVSILGLGAIGAYIAKHMAMNGYSVNGWSRSLKTIEGVNCFAGDAELHTMLGRSDIVVNCLPLTKTTRGFLGFEKLSLIKQGASLINISRGPVIDEAALLQLLDNDHLDLAVLDVFSQEPLPETSPLWTHPKVKITPHISGMTNPHSGAKIIAENILKVEKGEVPPHLYIPSI